MTNTGWCLSGELTQQYSALLEERIEETAEALGIFPPTLSRFEQPNTDLWHVDLYFPDQPDQMFIETLLKAADLVNWQYSLNAIEDKDWVSESQKLLAPVRAGRFLVFGSHDADKAEEALINIQIDAGQAFGTGKHETTAACLVQMDELATATNPRKILDLGTGSGVLALAAHKLWTNALVTATDIDPIAIEVAAENLTINHAISRDSHTQKAGITLAVADGMQSPNIQTNQPFDLIVANILSGPLIEMAASICAALSPTGSLILSGLLISQKPEVTAAYEKQGWTVEKSIDVGEWCALRLTSA
jgi:ribosomal protein L11 methyltransferase